ncbi:MAG: M48 family metallopeptidase [Phycisphaerales bacterium]
MLCAAFLLCMPVVYVASIVGIGWLTYWHATKNYRMVTPEYGSRAMVLSAFLYALPIAVGVVLIVFLLRPFLLLFEAEEEREGIEIFPGEEPRLFGFVEAVCQTMGAPAPEKIYIDCAPNAAAQFMGSGLAIFGRSRLALHIGLSLVAGMNASEFAGVLAHEFGHFSQGVGMRATVIFGKVTSWMARAAYSRGRLDDGIEEMHESESGYTIALGIALRLGIGCARLFLKIVLFAGFAVSQVMGRRMEFDADKHQARFVGSAATNRSWKNLVALQQSAVQAETMVAEQWHKRTLPEDLPSLIASIARRQSPDRAAEARKRMEERRTGWLDSHPAPGTRLDAIAGLNEPGVFRLEEPATTLFTNFPAASKRASYNHFKERVGEYIFSATFVPSATLFGSQEEEVGRSETARAFIGFDPPDFRPLSIDSGALSPADDPRRAWETIKTCRSRIKSNSDIERAVTAFVDSNQRLVQASAAPAVFGIGIGRLKKEFRYSFSGPKDLISEREGSTEAMKKAAATIDAALDAAGTRLNANLRLLATKGSEKRIPGAEAMRERAAILLPAHAALRKALPQLRAIREDLERGALLGVYTQDDATRDKAREAVRPISDNIREKILSLRQDWGGIPSPYPGADGATSLGGLVVRATPAWREYDQIFAAGADMYEKYTDTQRRITQELAEIAAKTEAALAGHAAKDRAESAR